MASEKKTNHNHVANNLMQDTLAKFGEIVQLCEDALGTHDFSLVKAKLSKYITLDDDCDLHNFSGDLVRQKKELSGT